MKYLLGKLLEPWVGIPLLLVAAVLLLWLFWRGRLKSLKIGPVELELNPIAKDDSVSTNAAKEEWPKGMPRKWWTAIKGRFDYWRASEMRAKLLEECESRNFGENLSEILKRDDIKFEIKPVTWESRPEQSKLPRVLVSGPAGVGKTIYLNDLVKKRLTGDGLVIELRSTDIDTAVKNRDWASFWENICKHFSEKESTNSRSLTRSAIAYGLNTQKIILIIEDLHNCGPVTEVFPFLKIYFKKYHHWSDRLNLFLTTREPIKNTRWAHQMETDVVTLEPLKALEPQDFFYFLCEENKIEFRVSAIGEDLSNAFSTPMTRTPLFVVICAWLAATSGRNEESVQHLLRENPSKIYESFINALFIRAKHTPYDYGSFSTAYEAIAVRLWPEWQGFTASVINDFLTGINPSLVSPVTTEFLVKNGFLFQSEKPFDVPRLAFPHQSIADYLIARRMVATNDYSPVTNHFVSTRVEGLVGFLGELITTKEALIALARDELSTCVKVLSSHPTLVRRISNATLLELMPELIAFAANWASNDVKRPVEIGTWEELRTILLQIKQGRDMLCVEIAKRGPSRSSIEAIAIIGGSESKRILEGWISERSDLFKDAVDVSYVKSFLIDLLEDIDTHVEQSWSAFKLASSINDSEICAAAEAYLRRRAGWLDTTLLDELIGLGEKWIGVFAYACEDSSNEKKRQISARVARRLEKALIIPGKYKVVDAGRAITVKINHPLLVPRQSKRLGIYKSAHEGLGELRRGGKLMTQHQAFVAIQHFADESNLPGVIFPPPDNSYNEALLTPTGNVELFVISDPRKTGVQLGSGPTVETRGSAAIFYREIKKL